MQALKNAASFAPTGAIAIENTGSALQYSKVSRCGFLGALLLPHELGHRRLVLQASLSPRAVEAGAARESRAEALGRGRRGDVGSLLALTSELAGAFDDACLRGS